MDEIIKMSICKNCGHPLYENGHMSVHDWSYELYSSRNCEQCDCNNPVKANKKEMQIYEDKRRRREFLHEDYIRRVKRAKLQSPKKLISCTCGCTGHGYFWKEKPIWKFW